LISYGIQQRTQNRVTGMTPKPNSQKKLSTQHYRGKQMFFVYAQRFCLHFVLCLLVVKQKPE